jgi:hypothetical protein
MYYNFGFHLFSSLVAPRIAISVWDLKLVPLVSPKIMKIGKTGPNLNFKLSDN